MFASSSLPTTTQKVATKVLLLRGAVAVSIISLCGLWAYAGFGVLSTSSLNGANERHRKTVAKEERVYPRFAMFEKDRLGGSSLRQALNRTAKLSYPKKKRRRKLRYPMVYPDYYEGYLKDSREFRHRSDPIETDECEPQYQWQVGQYPTCNSLHEYTGDMTNPLDMSAGEPYRENAFLIAHGYWRDVWIVNEEITNRKRVLKTLRYQHDVNDRNIDRNRRDAMALERLTKSKLVVGIYGYCSTSGLFEYSDGGDIYNALWPENERGETVPHNLTNMDKLHIATQAAMGLADVHNVDMEGKASIAHTDISADQFILIDGLWRINDFNRARFIGQYRHNGTNCPYCKCIITK